MKTAQLKQINKNISAIKDKYHEYIKPCMNAILQKEKLLEDSLISNADLKSFTLEDISNFVLDINDKIQKINELKEADLKIVEELKVDLLYVQRSCTVFLSNAHLDDKIGCFYTAVALESELVGRVVEILDFS